MWSSNGASDIDPSRATAEFYFASRRCALAVRRDFVGAYNKLSPEGGGMRVGDFSNDNFRMDETREREAFEAIGISKDLAWFIRHSIREGSSSLPSGCSPPELGRVLCDLDIVDAPKRVKMDFVDLAACIIKANL